MENKSKKDTTEDILDKILIKNGNSFEYNLEDLKDSIAGCGLNEETVMPCAGYLVLAWHVLSRLKNKSLNETPVVFEDTYFKEITPDEDSTNVTVTILPGSGNFEIYCKEKAVVKGNIREAKDISKDKLTLAPLPVPNDLPLNSKDVNQELFKRGYVYKDKYKTIVSADLDVKVGRIAWVNDWISFIDAVLQFDALSKNTRAICTAEKIARVVIDPKVHITSISASENVNVYRYTDKMITVSGGVEISGVTWTVNAKIDNGIDFESYAHGFDKKTEVIRLENKMKKVDRAHAISTGDLSTVHWVESPPLKTSSEGELCQVYYATLNYEDLVHASGKLLPGDEPGVFKERALGMEFSGVTASGRRVMGILPAAGALATDLIVDNTCLWDVPPDEPLECVATIPMAFFTAYYTLLVRGKMRLGDTVVVYCGASDIGQAAIHLALHHGCRVFSTYTNREQRQFISSRFLEVRDQMLGHDWHPDFENMVLKETAGIGVDIVVNLLGPKKLPAAVSCLAKGGKILDVIRAGTSAGKVRLPPLLENQSYHSINMASLTQQEKEIVSNLLSEGMRLGQVYYLTYTNTYSTDSLKEAFGALKSTDQSIGKVTVKIRKETKSDEKVARNLISAAQRVYFDAQKSYLIIGCQDSVSMDFGHWLISRGATRIVISTDRMVTGYQTLCVKRWQDQGKQVKIVETQVTDPGQVTSLLCEARQLGSVGGIFDLSTFGEMEKNVDVALQGIKALDMVTRENTEKLEHFAVITSLINTNFINATKKVIESRQKKKLPGILIQLRLNDNAKKTVSPPSLKAEFDAQQTMACFLNSLDSLLAQPYSMVSCVPTLKKMAE